MAPMARFKVDYTKPL